MRAPPRDVFWSLVEHMAGPEGCFVSAQGWINPEGYLATVNTIDVLMYTLDQLACFTILAT